MNERALIWFLRAYLVAVFIFVFAPIVASMIFSFNSDRFPTIPLGTFTVKWYQQIWSNDAMWEAMRNSLIVASSVSLFTLASLCCRQPFHW